MTDRPDVDERPRWYVRPCAVCSRALADAGLMTATIRRGVDAGAIEVLDNSLVTTCSWRCLAAWATARLVDEQLDPRDGDRR